MLLCASPAIAGGGAARGRTTGDKPFGQKNPLNSFQVEAQHFADAVGRDVASAVRLSNRLRAHAKLLVISSTDNKVRFTSVLSFVYAPHGADHTVLHGLWELVRYIHM